MELSSEDSLRLNVLLANAEAVRLDEGAMTVYGLAGEKEMKVPLNPTGRSDRYLVAVRELLSGAVLGSPGGYPVFLRRWTRMGQVDNDKLDKLLMLGEPEAVVAVACAPSLTDELARRAWWVAPDAENARRMLSNPAIVGGPMGAVLAEYLVEYLPFESEHQNILESVCLVLQPGLISEERRLRLWEAGRNKKTYRVAFLAAQPENLPEQAASRSDTAGLADRLAPLAQRGNPAAVLLGKLLDAPGQGFMEVAADALHRPADQDVYSALLNAVGAYFAAVRQSPEQLRDLEAVAAAAERAMAGTEASELLRAVPELAAEVRAMLTLAHLDEGVVIPIFSLTDAVGTVMRSKVEPISRAVLQQFAVLRGQG